MTRPSSAWSAWGILIRLDAAEERFEFLDDHLAFGRGELLPIAVQRLQNASHGIIDAVGFPTIQRHTPVLTDLVALSLSCSGNQSRRQGVAIQDGLEKSPPSP